jgi:heat-inducible transcriptional repressor
VSAASRGWQAPGASANSKSETGARLSATREATRTATKTAPVTASAGASPSADPPLTDRQVLVLRAIVASYVGEAAPVGSRSLSHVLPVALSSASIRNTMAELTAFGLVEKPHASAGRVPTASGLRCFIDHLVPRDLDEFERRDLAGSVGTAEPDALLHSASQLLSERTRQLGFVVAPREAVLVVRHVALVRLSTSRVLAVVVSHTGTALRRVFDDEDSGDQPELDRLAAMLNERVAGKTLAEVRDALAREASALRTRAQTVLERALRLGWRALQAQDDDREPGDLVIATRLALLDQPEFQDPSRVKQLFSAIEAKESLLRILHRMIDAARGPADDCATPVAIALGEELDEPELRTLALVAAPYGSAGAPLGVLGVIGPLRMDYPRVVALVRYLGALVTERLAP